ncbi:Hypp4856 [Branchiostoma lanceolatum]|uniref:Hypp4856 protein n=1 Tax=Branchiostoma lanceolatum TaxID=7740 RepID=A0A8K0ABF8_BRALA|nr:Hypp4856 [Branchiostoma lanceolatum]
MHLSMSDMLHMPKLFILFACTLAFVYGAQKNLVLVGGNLQEDNEQVYSLIVELAGGRGNAKIGLVTAANLNPENSAQYYQDMFQGRYGAVEATWIPIDIYRKENNSDPEVVALINGMTGFFFGGGDQIYVIESLYIGDRQESPALAAIRAKFEAGTVVAGTSAGAACQSSAVMIVFVGLSYNALAHGVNDYYDSDTPDEVAYNRSGGIGLAPRFVVDVHFSEKGREGRLIRLLADTKDEPNGATLGVGVDENTALHLTWDTDPDSAVGTVVGAGGVMMVDISSAVISTSRDFDIKDAVISYLTEEDRVNFATKQVTFAPWKQSLSGNERFDHAVGSDDIFGSPYAPYRKSREWNRVATSLFNSRLDDIVYGRTYEKNPQFEVCLYENPLCKQVVMSNEAGGAEAVGGNSTTTGNYVISYKGMTVRIHPYDATSTTDRCRANVAFLLALVFVNLFL